MWREENHIIVCFRYYKDQFIYDDMNNMSKLEEKSKEKSEDKFDRLIPITLVATNLIDSEAN